MKEENNFLRFGSFKNTKKIRSPFNEKIVHIEDLGFHLFFMGFHPLIKKIPKKFLLINI